MMLFRILTVLTIDLFLTIVSIDSRAVDPRCQPMRIPWCLGVYDAVIFPNFLGHQNQEDAYYAMHKLWPLIQGECSPQILHYLCRLYAPQCPFFVQDRDASYVSYHPQQYRPPCEDACMRVRHDCYPIMAQHHIHWPEELECHRLRNADCIETPQIEVKPTERMEEPRTEPPRVEETTEMVTTTEEMTTAAEVTPESVKPDESTESPDESEESTPAPEPEPEPEPETATVTTGADGLMEVTPDDDGEDDKSPEVLVPEDEATTHATTASTADETPEATEAVPEEETTEPVPAPEPSPEDEESTEAPAEPAPITTDATTGSLLGISPVIQEEVTTDASEGSGEDDEATTAVPAAPAVAEPEPEAEAATVADVDAAEATTMEETAAASEDETTSSDQEINEATAPSAVLDETPAGPGHVRDPSATVSQNSENESPRSDRAVGSSADSHLNVGVSGMMIIYLVSLSIIFHRGA